jgi:hypothetical protein
MQTTDFFLSEAETAAYLKISKSKLRNDRFKRCGLPYVKLDRLVRYRLSDIKSYLEERYIEPSAEFKKR